jgi:hypothetical protein
MSQQDNIDDIFVDEDEGDAVEEGEIIEGNHHNSEEESKEDEDEGWGGEENEVIIPQMEIVAALLGIGPVTIQREQSENTHNFRRSLIRPRDEVFTQPLPNKIYRNVSGKRVIRKRTPFYSYLKLKSGEEFNFTEEDGKMLLLNEAIEPSRLIRNIISKTPRRMVERMEYLGKFESEEESEEEESEEENNEKVQKRYMGNLKEAVYEAYIKEWRLRFVFKKLLILWRIHKMNKSCEKELDPITLSEPENEVYIYDWDNRKKFVFDAKSLATLIETKLMYHEYGFPAPMYPRNPKNNVEFSYKQLISLFFQLKKYGEQRWGFTTLREFNFSKHRWHLYHKSALTINSIKSNLSQLDTADGRDLLLDFIFAKMDELEISHNTNIYNIYHKAMIRVPNHWYLQKLKSLAISHYEAEHFGQNRERAINYNCEKIFKNQNRFFNDLKNKKIIP